MASHQEFGLNSLQRLKSLCQMLRDDADKIISGQMGITITSQTLYELNEALDNLQDGLSPPHLSTVISQPGGQGSGITDHARGQGSRGTGCAGGRGAELEEWNFHLQLVLDVVAKAPVLVLYKGKQNGTPSSAQPDHTLQPVRLGYFTSLNHLEISFLQIQAIQDLLKTRERLETLVVISCFADNFQLQDVLEMCDQEVSIPMQWTALRTLCVRCSRLRELDGSLRLCPRLETLDLSRNRLVTTEAYLGYLMELSYVDLSYNDLTVMPSFSATAKKKIRVLLLAGNKLVDIRGVEEMTSLEELDVSENLIHCHNSLAPVRTLHRLDKLNMIACPASIRKDHRLRALQHISTVSLSRKFTLDGRPTTHKEIQNSRALLDHYSRRQFSAPVPYSSRQTVQTADSMTAYSVREQQEEGRVNSEDTSIKVISTRSKKGRKKTKARTMDIQDMDTSTGGELSSRDVTPSTTPKMPSRMEALAQMRRQELQEKRAEMEQLRRYYGNNWLQAVEDKEVIPRPASLVGVSSLAGGETTQQQHHSNRKPASTREQESNDERQTVIAKADIHAPTSSERTHGNCVREQEKAGAQNIGEGSSKKTLSAKVDIHAPIESHNSIRKNVLSGADNGRDSSPEFGAFHRDTMFSSSAAEDSGADIPSSPPLQNHFRIQHSGNMGDESRLTEETFLSESGEETVGGERLVERGGRVKEDMERSSATNSSTLEPEPEDQSEPFIVTLPDDPDHHLIVTVSPRYLVEKDINGVMQDQLDLQSLESVGVEVQEKSEDVGEFSDLDLKEIRVSLNFSYVRKDRRCREYVMEDIVTAQHFRELVQPFVDARVEAVMKKLHVQHQCLKCNWKFSRAQARTVVQSNMPSTGSSKDIRSLADKGVKLGEKVVLQCPKCGSDHVVQLESGTEADSTATGPAWLPSEAVRPSSLRHRPSFDQVMGTPPPVAHSTPLKHNASTSDVPSVASSLHRRGSKPFAFRSLFGKDDQDYKQQGDGPVPNSGASTVGSLDSAATKRDYDNLLNGRTRSNAFYNQPPESRQRSDAVSSPQEFIDRQTKRSSGSILSEGSDITGKNSRSSTSNSLTRNTDVSQLATFGALNNLHLAVSSSIGSEVSPSRIGGGGLSSVDSDIMILNKRDSVSSVVVLASSDSASDMLQTDTADGRSSSITQEEDNRRLAFVVRNEVVSDENEVDRVAISAHESRKLTPVPQERDDSVEVTPMGSPLSSSICSSMVSSVYLNSLLPNTSASSVYITASEQSREEKGGGSAADGGADEKEGNEDADDNELSIYDQVETTPSEERRGRRSSTHKMSISSEVEVLCVEEEATIRQSWERSQDEELDDNQQHRQAVSSSAALAGVEDRRPMATSSPLPLSTSPSMSAAVAGTESVLSEGMESTGELTGYNFNHLDHRLALHLMMTVFTNDEEFKFKVKSCVSQYMMANEYEALVVVTSLKLYILRINTEDPSVELTEGLTLMEAQPHAELKRVDIGLGNQTIRLEYGSDCSSYTLVLRDEDKLDAVKELLSDQLLAFAMETEVPISAVFTEDADQLTMDNLTRDVLTRGSSTDQLLLYTLGYIARGHNPEYPVAFVVSSSEVTLLNTNHQWPSPHLQAPITVETVGKQFTVLERQGINNIATLEIHEENHCRLRITFFNETSGDETQWLVTMETEKGVKGMVEAIRQPWEEAFGVEMDVEYSPFPMTF